MSGCTVRSRAFGSHTITLGAVVSSPDRIFVPLSRDIRSWSVDKQRDMSIPTIHRSIITFISQSPSNDATLASNVVTSRGVVTSRAGRYLVSCDWSGVVAVHDPCWKLKYTFTAPNAPAATLKFLSPNKLVVLSRGTDDFKPGNVSVYELGELEAVNIASVYDDIFQIACHGEFIYAWKWIMPEFSLLRYNEKLEILHSYENVFEKSPTVGYAINDDHIILALKSRHLCWLDGCSMQPHSSEHLKTVAKSPIWAMQFVTNNQILIQKSLNVFVVVDVITGNTVKKFHGPESFACFMELIKDYLWIGTVDGLFRLDFTQSECDLYMADEPDENVTMLTPSMTSFLFHEVSCCGVCLDNNDIVSGDLGGNIFIWDASSAEIEPLFRTKIADSIRCLGVVRTGATHSPDIVVFIGTLTGCLLQWSPGESPVPVASKEDTITCIKIAGEQLCVCLVTGEIELYQICYSEQVVQLEPRFQLKIHHPHHPTSYENAKLFGSLKIKAEIWSCAFSPCHTKLATCSEDQTVKVTSLVTRDNLATFQDHALAVTCVTWFQHSSLSLLASCSDDNTIVVREMETLVKLKVLPCPQVIGFCTLTYLGVIVSEPVKQCIESSCVAEEKGGHESRDIIKTFEEQCKDSIKILCCSENGYLIIRELVDGRTLFNERVHQGSIEGLCCGTGGTVVTCSSDCVVQLHSIGD